MKSGNFFRILGTVAVLGSAWVMYDALKSEQITQRDKQKIERSVPQNKETGEITLPSRQEITLPSRQEKAKKSLENIISGSVIWPNYSPVENARVSLLQQESDLNRILGKQNIEPTTTNNQGNFSFKVPHRIQYNVVARFGDLQTTSNGAHPGE